MSKPTDAARDRVEYELFSKLIAQPEDDGWKVIRSAEHLRKNRGADGPSFWARCRVLFGPKEAGGARTQFDSPEERALVESLANCQEDLLDRVVSMAAGFWELRSEEREATNERPEGEPLFSLGTYQVFEELGGGMGTVYKAWQEPPRRVVALKVIGETQQYTPAARNRFRAEAHKAAKLDHPGLVPVLEVGEVDGQLYYSMPFVEGRDLAEWIQEKGSFSPAEAAEVIRSVAYAVQYAHELGIVHCDLKPENILLDAHGSGIGDLGAPRVTDFGVARSRDRGQLDEGQGGTPSYMAPEQHNPSLHPDQRADVFALGVILYEMIHGAVPFEGGSCQELLAQKNRGANDLAGPRTTTMPPDLAAIVRTCLQANKRRRYATAREVADELDRFLGGRPVEARPVKLPERFRKWARRQPWAAATVAVVAVSLFAAAAGSLIAAGIYRDERDRADINAQVAIANAKEVAIQYRRAEWQRERAEDSFYFTQEQMELTLVVIGHLDHREIAPDALFYFFGLDEELEQKVKQWEEEVSNEAIDEYPTTHFAFANALSNLARMKAALRSPSESLPIYRKAVDAYETLVAKYPEVGGYRLKLADLLNDRAVHLVELGDFDKADVALRRAGELMADFAVQKDNDVDTLWIRATTYMNLGAMHGRQGDRHLAKTSLVKARDLFERVVNARMPRYLIGGFRNLSGIENNLAAMHRSDGNLGEALSVMEANVHRQKAFLEDAMWEYGEEMTALYGSSCNGLGQLYMQNNQYTDALDRCEEARDILEQLDSKEIRYQRYLARCYRNLGMLHILSERLDQGEEFLSKAVGIFDRLGPELLEGMTDLAADAGTVYCQLAMIKIRRYEYDEARDLIDRGLPFLEGNRLSMSDVPEHGLLLETAHFLRAHVMMKQGRYPNALESADRVLSLSVGDEKLERIAAMIRAVALAGTGEHAKAIEEAQRTLADSPARNTMCWEYMARVHALASAEARKDPFLAPMKSQALSASHALVAIEFLIQAKQDGHFRDEQVANDLKNDPAFDSLRDNPDFIAVWKNDVTTSRSEKPFSVERLDDDWRRVKDRELGIAFDVPGEPNRQTRNQTLPGGATKRVTYRVRRYGGASMLTVEGAPIPVGTPANAEPFDELRMTHRMQGKILEETEVALDGHVGREFLVEMPGGVYVRQRFFAVQRMMYLVNVTGRDRELTPAETRFYESVRLLKKGEPVGWVADPTAVDAELKKLEGLWRLVRAERDGVDIMDRLSYNTMRIEGDLQTVEGEGDTHKSQFVIDPTQNPKEVTATSFGDPIRGIYELDGNTLRYLFAKAGFQRPKSFSDHGFFYQYERVTASELEDR